MISLPYTAKVYILYERVSFHRQIDGLCAVVRQMMGKDPVSSSFFVFRNRGNHSLRILHFDGSGIWLCTKRFTSVRLGKIWPQGPGDYSPLLVRDLQAMIWGGESYQKEPGPGWRKVA
jgi:transposase